MSAGRLLIDIILLFLAAENLAFIVKYASFSQWQNSWLGRSIMLQKTVLFLICLMFPVNSFLMQSDDAGWFKTIQVILFLCFAVAFAIDFGQLFQAQRAQALKTFAWVRKFLRR